MSFFVQVTIELASDSREFSNALAKTRLAEMTDPKIVPIPQPMPVSKPIRRRSSSERAGLHLNAGDYSCNVNHGFSGKMFQT